jgi:hypothetical protein
MIAEAEPAVLVAGANGALGAPFSVAPRPSPVERERRLGPAPRSATRGDTAVAQAHRGDDLVDDDERDLTIVRARQLDPIAHIVGLRPRRDDAPIVPEQRHASLAQAPFDLDSKHDLTHLPEASAARYLPVSR